MTGKFYVLGMSKFGAGIASILSNNGEDVVAVDLKASAFLKLDHNYSGCKVIGDILDLDFLIEQGIKEAQNVIVATNYDNVNIYIGYVCDKIFNNKNIYIRLAGHDKEELFKNTNINPIYPFQLSLEYFLNLAGNKQWK